MTLIDRRPWAFAILYTGLSLAVEIVLLVVFRLQIPQDNAVISPVVLTVPPLLAAWFSGYRRPLRDFLTVALSAAILTLMVTLIVTNLTGINTGLAEPIFNRSLAGFLAAMLTNRTTRAAVRVA